jgi:hypothetical protein
MKIQALLTAIAMNLKKLAAAVMLLLCAIIEHGAARPIRASVGRNFFNSPRGTVFCPAALPQKSGAHPNMPGVSYAPAGHPSQMVVEVGHPIIFDI